MALWAIVAAGFGRQFRFERGLRWRNRNLKGGIEVVWPVGKPPCLDRLERGSTMQFCFGEKW